MGPRQQAGGLGGEEVHDRFGDVRQPGAGLLRAQVRGHAPEGLFAGEPHAVDDLVDEAALGFHAFGDDEVLQFLAAAVADGLVARTVAVALVFQEERGGQHVPGRLQLSFAGGQERGPRIGGQRLPGGAVGGSRIGAEPIARRERRGRCAPRSMRR